MPPAEPRPGTSVIAGTGSFAVADHRAGDEVITLPHAVAAVSDLRQLNHSCDANIGWADERTLVALRAIDVDEELTVDYSTAIDDPDFVLYCHCGSTRCRQAVEGTDWQIPQLHSRYAGHWTPRLQQRIDEGR